MQKKSHQVKRSDKRFIETFPKWVDFFLPFEENEQKQDLSSTMRAPTGRPSLQFATCRYQTKQRRTESLRSQVSVCKHLYSYCCLDPELILHRILFYAGLIHDLQVKQDHTFYRS